MIFSLLAVAWVVGFLVCFRVAKWTSTRHGFEELTEIDDGGWVVVVCAFLIWPVLAVVGLGACFVLNKRLYFSPEKAPK